MILNFDFDLIDQQLKRDERTLTYDRKWINLMKRLLRFRAAASSSGEEVNGSASHPPEDDENSLQAADDDGSSASDDDSENNGSYASQYSRSGSGDDGGSSLASLESMTSVGSIQYLFQKVNRSYNAVRNRSINAFKMSSSPTRTKSNNNGNNMIIRNNSSSVQAVPEENAVHHGVDDECSGEYDHGLVEGDHVIRWKMLGYLYPIQIHGELLGMLEDCCFIFFFSSYIALNIHISLVASPSPPRILRLKRHCTISRTRHSHSCRLWFDICKVL